MADNPQPGDPDGNDDDASMPPNMPNPFGAGPFGAGGGGQFDPSTFDFSQIDFSGMMHMLSSTGPVNWEVARQTASWVALEGRPEPTIDAADRKQFEELVHAAQTLVVGETGLYATFATPIQTVGPQGWVDLHLVALRPVLEALAESLGEAMRAAGDEPDSDEDLSAMFPGLPAGLPIGDVLRMVAPALLGVQAGSMIGYLAQHAFGRYDLPLPTGALPDGDEPSLTFVVSNVDGFEQEWTLPRDVWIVAVY